MKKYSF